MSGTDPKSRSSNKKVVFALSIGFVLISICALPVVPRAFAASVSDPSVVQYAHNYCLSCSSLTISFGSSSTQGDMVVVAIGVAWGSGYIASVSDNLAGSYTLGVSSESLSECQTTNTPFSGGCAYIFYNELPIGGYDTITVSLNGFPAIASATIFEISGVSSSSVVTTSTGSGSTNTASTSPLYFANPAFVIGVVGVSAPLSALTPSDSAFTSYLNPYTGTSTDGQGGVLYSTLASSPSDLTASLSYVAASSTSKSAFASFAPADGTSIGWSEVALAFGASMVATPEFPLGTILAILAPIGATGLFIVTKRKQIVQAFDDFSHSSNFVHES